MRWYSNVIFALVICCVLILSAESAVPKKNRPVRRDETNGKVECHYNKSPWSDCDSKTNMRTRTLTLKKIEDETKCEKTKTVQKKCKKICRYEKGAWSKCNAQNEMTRTDTLKNPTESDPTCEKTRLTTKKCKNKADRSAKGQKLKHQRNHQKEQQQQGQQQAFAAQQ